MNKFTKTVLSGMALMAVMSTSAMAYSSSLILSDEITVTTRNTSGTMINPIVNMEIEGRVVSSRRISNTITEVNIINKQKNQDNSKMSFVVIIVDPTGKYHSFDSGPVIKATGKLYGNVTRYTGEVNPYESQVDHYLQINAADYEIIGHEFDINNNYKYTAIYNPVPLVTMEAQVLTMYKSSNGKIYNGLLMNDISLYQKPINAYEGQDPDLEGWDFAGGVLAVNFNINRTKNLSTFLDTLGDEWNPDASFITKDIKGISIKITGKFQGRSYIELGQDGYDRRNQHYIQVISVEKIEPDFN